MPDQIVGGKTLFRLDVIQRNGAVAYVLAATKEEAEKMAGQVSEGIREEADWDESRYQNCLYAAVFEPDHDEFVFTDADGGGWEQWSALKESAEAAYASSVEAAYAADERKRAAERKQGATQ